eukprot:6811498-Alexandrium_andersonii.AAC.1
MVGARCSCLSCVRRVVARRVRGCGACSCVESCVAVAVLALCRMVVWYAMVRYAEMMGWLAVESVRL